MLKKEILEKLRIAIIDLEDDEVNRLLQEGLKAGLMPIDMVTEGLNPGLTIIGEGYAASKRFMSEMVLAGEIMNDAMNILRPVMEHGGHSLGETMVIGTVEGDLHTIGKKIVSAVFTGAGYRVVDIGEDMPASEFLKAVKDHKATIIGASAILGPVKPYCKVINDALVDAGIRNNVIYTIGGWGMTQDWCNDVGADCYGEDGIDALNKVKLILAKKRRVFNGSSKKTS